MVSKIIYDYISLLRQSVSRETLITVRETVQTAIYEMYQNNKIGVSDMVHISQVIDWIYTERLSEVFKDDSSK